ncbi:membrane protein of unknown function [Methylocella tundrae]|uniref:Cation/H+ exchanger transmembrane domain-containing protein n=1 Tax=Methylocella tundrae TaxID=227605 RepID=A0A4V6YUH3_METTU|nr:membrane protein of unknown function [Methylocella tundrae]
MQHAVPLITTVAAAFGVALIFGFFAAKLKLPALVGYLLAGVIIGPFSPGFVANGEIASQLAEIGVMLLMFGVGLHFSLEDLWDVRKVALPGAILQIAVATALGAALALYWGWGLGGALVFGLALSVASTVVLLKALENRGVLDTTNGRIAVGWLIVEDLAMVLVLVLLPPLSGVLGGHAAVGAGPDLWWTLEITVAKIAGFVTVMLVVGRRVFPLAFVAGRAYWLARALHALRRRRGGQPCLWRSRVIRRFFCPWRIFRRHGHPRIRIQPPRRRGIAPLARRLLGVVLCFGRHAVRPQGIDRPAFAHPRGGRHHHCRQVARGGGPRLDVPLSAQHGPDGFGEPRADRRIFFHSGGSRHEAWPSAA